MIFPLHFHVFHELTVLDLKSASRHEDETKVFSCVLKGSQYMFYFHSKASGKGF